MSVFTSIFFQQDFLTISSYITHVVAKSLKVTIRVGPYGNFKL